MSGIKKGQISIFIVIAVMIVVLLIFLINMDSNNNSRDLDKINSQINSIDLNVISEELDSCVEFGLRKALIIAGSRGGLIYGDLNHEYVKSNLPPNTYSEEFLQKLEINLVSLETSILHVSDDLYFPEIDKANKFEYSIKENFERYLFEHIVQDCSNLQNFENLGIDLIRNDAAGRIISINNPTKVIATGMDVNINDKVRFYIDDNTYTGNVDTIDDNGGIFITSDVEIDLVTNTNINDIVIYNLNSDLEIEILFDDETISAEINYPLYTNSTKNNVDSYATSFITLPVRFTQILQVSKNLMLAKLDNRALNYGPNGDLNEVLNYESTYLKNTDLVNIEFHKNIINDTLDYKLFTYTFIDEDSKILGIPFIFRMGYENEAPKFKDGICTLENGECIIRSNSGTINIPLSDYITESNLQDSYKTRFEAVDEITTTSSFSVNNAGELSFSATEDGRYSYDITVSDGETYRTQNIVFIVE